MTPIVPAGCDGGVCPRTQPRPVALEAIRACALYFPLGTPAKVARAARKILRAKAEHLDPTMCHPAMSTVRKSR